MNQKKFLTQKLAFHLIPLTMLVSDCKLLNHFADSKLQSGPHPEVYGRDYCNKGGFANNHKQFYGQVDWEN
jgi:hypothetical protein